MSVHVKGMGEVSSVCVLRLLSAVRISVLGRPTHHVFLCSQKKIRTTRSIQPHRRHHDEYKRGNNERTRLEIYMASSGIVLAMDGGLLD